MLALAGIGLNGYAQLSEAKFTLGSSTSITSTTNNSPFRISVQNSSSTLNGTVEIGSQNAGWVHFITTTNPRYYFNQPVFINNINTPGNGAVLSSYGGLSYPNDASLILATGNSTTGDGTDLHTPRLTINSSGQHIYGHTTGQRWRFDTRSGNSGDFFHLGFDDGAGTFNNHFTVHRDPITKVVIGTNWGTGTGVQPHSTLNILSRSNNSTYSNVMTLKFGEPGTGSVCYGAWDVAMHADASTSNTKCNLSFTAQDGTSHNNTPVLALFQNGNVSIAEKLTCREVLVNNTVPWPDYVFSPDYKLPELKTVETFIKANKHLPDVPSEKEIAEQGGAKLGEMNTILLRKVEELTLYTIQQQKELEQMKKEIELLKTTSQK